MIPNYTQILFIDSVSFTGHRLLLAFLQIVRRQDACASLFAATQTTHSDDWPVTKNKDIPTVYTKTT